MLDHVSDAVSAVISLGFSEYQLGDNCYLFDYHYKNVQYATTLT